MNNKRTVWKTKERSDKQKNGLQNKITARKTNKLLEKQKNDTKSKIRYEKQKIGLTNKGTL